MSVKILGIETSCDETAAAVVDCCGNVLSNIIYSQIDIHKQYGGVVPEIAARNHVVKVDNVVEQALQTASVTLSDIDAIAVTYGPGLVGALLAGLNFAKALSYSASIPLIAVNHLEGHIASAYLENPSFTPPFVALIASGGHSHLVHVRGYGDYAVLGQTTDDAAGEAFDKVARTLNLPYPGGIEIDRLATAGDPASIPFTRPKAEGELNFSFSGLKSAVLNYLNAAKMKGEAINPADVAASFQQAVVDILTANALKACKATGATSLAVVGGVACNSQLKASLVSQCVENSIKLHIPKPIFCTDNAAMIAMAAHPNYTKKDFATLDLNAVPSLKL